MERTDRKSEIQLRSPEVQQLIGRMPKGFMRYGTTLILSLLILVLIASAFIPYGRNEQIRLRILPNERTRKVCAETDGTVVQCFSEGNASVCAGDTLLSYSTPDGSIRHILSPQTGTVHFRRFCVVGEDLKKGEALLDIHSASAPKEKVFAIADRVPSSTDISSLDNCTTKVGDMTLTFRVKRTLTDPSTHLRSVLLESVQAASVTQEFTTDQATTSEGTLLGQLFGKRF